MTHEDVSDQMFPPSIDSIALAIVADTPSTWRLHAWHRHQGASQGGCPPDIYERVAPDELLGLVDAVVSALVDWPSAGYRPKA